jgi:polyisoprenoid-binding protein YceI
MKKICKQPIAILLAIAHVLPALVFTQGVKLTPAQEGSSVAFKIKNFGISVDGSLKQLNGTIDFQSTNVLQTVFQVSVASATINTGIGARDNHLRKADYFDVSTYPKISFTSSKVVNSNKAGTYFVYGTLRIKNTAKEISFPFTVKETSGGYLFEGSFKINRRDYGVGGKSISLSDEATVQLSVLAK